MPREFEKPVVTGGPFLLGEWLVEPSLNRLSRGDTMIQLELKVMDVLVCLAEQAGELVPRREIVDRVWATEFIADNTLTHAITELRNAFGDDARNSSFIETIYRRGYRLIASVEAVVSDVPGISKVARFPVPERAKEDDRNPYPGLAAFTEANAEFFFGREDEVAQMWRKLTSRRLLAVIGPSGVGKSSLLRAGLLPAAPGGWGTLVCQPGEGPFASLARALAPEFEGDPEAISKLVDIGDETAAVAIVSRWRERHEQALLVVDQFEELFTLNPPEVQERFAKLLARLARDADVHVLLSMRDDFLYRCHDHDALMPIFSELTPVKVPSPEDLRRALVQPAARLGYSFDDDGLADEMLEAVKGERGALPMLAFAVARLWEKRDTEKKELTRSEYQAIGGVSGALAQHAESTLTAIGQDRLPIVRELFRNLVTAEGTRATREVENLLSVFPDAQREEAAQVLRRLIDARLLTSFEEEAVEGNAGHHRVEVVHESLLLSWPRLVGWQTQDADSARLRDELRQAAKAWAEHDRPNDWLWAGAQYREFASWRERYPGGLSAVEEEFAAAMTDHAKRRKRRRRFAVAAAFVVLLAVLAVTGSFWRQSDREARRAEAAELVALGQLELEGYPTAALAHAIASLDLADSQAARMLALEALWKGPTALVVNETPTLKVQFTSDGRWLTQSYFASGDGPVRVIGANGLSELLPETRGNEYIYPPEMGKKNALFSMHHWEKEPSGKIVTKRVTLWSALENRMLGEARYEGQRVVWATMNSDDCRLVIVLSDGEGRFSVDTLSFDGAYERLGTREFDIQTDGNRWRFNMNHRTGRRIAASTGHNIYVIEVGDHELSEPRLVGRQRDLVSAVAVDPMGRLVATSNEKGLIRLWDLIETSRPQTLQGPPTGWLSFTDDGSFLTSRKWPIPGELEYWIWSLDTNRPEFLRRVLLGESAPMSGTALDTVGLHLVRTGVDLKIRLWPLSAPADAESLALLRGEVGQVFPARFHPQGQWLAGADNAGVAFWPLARPYPSVIRLHKEEVGGVLFGPQGRWLASSSRDGTVRLWPLEGESPPPGRILFDDAKTYLHGLATSPDGDQLLVGGGNTRGAGQVLLLSVGDESPRTLAEASSQYFGVALSPDGQLAAAANAAWTPSLRHISVWDVASGEQITVLAQGESAEFANPQFVGDGHLMALDRSGLRRWNIESGESELLYKGSIIGYAASADGRRVLLKEAPTADETESAIFVNLDTGAKTPLASRGDRIGAVSLDAAGEIAVTGGPDGTIRVGSVTGEEPHLLLGHEHAVTALAVDPLGRWIASGSMDTTVRLWPMPDLSKPPLHTLPHDELIAKLKTLTNLRVVRDEASATGWKLEVGPFPGWETVPTW